jgi:hypothetical protein
MPSKKYLDYVPLEPKKKKVVKKKDTTGLVTDDSFRLMFGFDYPTVHNNHLVKHSKSFKNPYQHITKWQK